MILISNTNLIRIQVLISFFYTFFFYLSHLNGSVKKNAIGHLEKCLLLWRLLIAYFLFCIFDGEAHGQYYIYIYR